MTATAIDRYRLLELDADMRSAWSAYSERLRQLTGDEYAETEAEAWAELQYELDRVHRAREELSTTSVETADTQESQ
ncbi:MAG: hypothetical protein ACRDL8_22070 [Solirubrobacteraceae bacterium]